jgi:hypothetical protein
MKHVTNNHHLFESFHPMVKGELQVKTANINFVDAEGAGIISFFVNGPNAKPARIVLQYVLYVPACGTNNLRSIIQLMRKGVNFDFKLDGATVTLGSVLVYEAPLITSLLVRKASATSTSISKVSEAIDKALSSVSEISKAYSNIRHTVDEKDIVVWHARLGHLA